MKLKKSSFETVLFQFHFVVRTAIEMHSRIGGENNTSDVGAQPAPLSVSIPRYCSCCCCDGRLPDRRTNCALPVARRRRHPVYLLLLPASRCARKRRRPPMRSPEREWVSGAVAAPVHRTHGHLFSPPRRAAPAPARPLALLDVADLLIAARRVVYGTASYGRPRSVGTWAFLFVHTRKKTYAHTSLRFIDQFPIFREFRVCV